MHCKHQVMLQSDSSFTKLWKLTLSTPTPYFMSLCWMPFRPDIEQLHCLFSKNKGVEMLRIKVLFISRTLWYQCCECVRNTLTIRMFVIGMMKLVFFSLFLDAFPPRPKVLFGQWYVLSTYTTYIKGVLGLGGKGVVQAKEDINHLWKSRPLCKMVVYIVHQLN